MRADAVRQMLGLADRTRVIDLFDSLARGDIASAFKEFREQYDVGADPIVVLSDLAEFVNFVTRVKVVPATADNVAFGETERVRAREFASKLSMRVLSRMWQMLLKGITEVQAATRPAAAAEMVLVRIAYVADLPTPDEAIKMLEQNGGASPVVSGSAAPRGAPASHGFRNAVGAAPGCRVRRAAEPKRPRARKQSRPRPSRNRRPRFASPVFRSLSRLPAKSAICSPRPRWKPTCGWCASRTAGSRSALESHASRSLITDLSRKLEQWTGRRWTVIVSNEAGQPTLRSQSLAEKSQRERAAEADPRVQEVLARFPGAKVVEVRRLAVEPPESEDISEDPAEIPDRRLI